MAKATIAQLGQKVKDAKEEIEESQRPQDVPANDDGSGQVSRIRTPKDQFPRVIRMLTSIEKKVDALTESVDDVTQTLSNVANLIKHIGDVTDQMAKAVFDIGVTVGALERNSKNLDELFRHKKEDDELYRKMNSNKAPDGKPEQSNNSGMFLREGIGSLLTTLVGGTFLGALPQTIEALKENGKLEHEEIQVGKEGVGLGLKALRGLTGLKLAGGVFKVLPWVGSLFAFFSAYKRVESGDYLGAMIDSATGLLDLTGLGSMAAIGLSGLNALRDAGGGSADFGLNKMLETGGEKVWKWTLTVPFLRGTAELLHGIWKMASGSVFEGAGIFWGGLTSLKSDIGDEVSKNGPKVMDWVEKAPGKVLEEISKSKAMQRLVSLGAGFMALSTNPVLGATLISHALVGEDGIMGLVNKIKDWATGQGDIASAFDRGTADTERAIRDAMDEKERAEKIKEHTQKLREMETTAKGSHSAVDAAAAAEMRQEIWDLQHPGVSKNIYVPKTGGTAAWRDNNPGNIGWTKSVAEKYHAVGFDTLPDGHRNAVFASLDEGNKARYDMLFEGKYSGKTLAQTFGQGGWAEKPYGDALSKETGIPGSTIMGKLDEKQRQAVMASQQRHEGFKPGTSKPPAQRVNEFGYAFETRPGKPDAIVMHHTATKTGQQAMNALKSRGLSANFLIDTDGKIFQLVDPDKEAYHVMNSWNRFHGEGDKEFSAAAAKHVGNANSIGIEIVGMEDEDFTPAQMRSAKQLGEALMQRYSIPKERVFGHGEVNPHHREAGEGMRAVNQIRGRETVYHGSVTVAGMGTPSGFMSSNLRPTEHVDDRRGQIGNEFATWWKYRFENGAKALKEWERNVFGAPTESKAERKIGKAEKSKAEQAPVIVPLMMPIQTQAPKPLDKPRVAGLDWVPNPGDNRGINDYYLYFDAATTSDGTPVINSF